MDTFSAAGRTTGRPRGRRLRPLPAARRAPPSAGRHAVRRRAADARAGPRPHHRPGRDPAGRAVDGPGAHDRRPSCSSVVQRPGGERRDHRRGGAVRRRHRLRRPGGGHGPRPHRTSRVHPTRSQTSSPPPTSGPAHDAPDALQSDRAPGRAAAAPRQPSGGAVAGPGRGRRARRLRRGRQRARPSPSPPASRRCSRSRCRSEATIVARHRHPVERRAGLRSGEHVLPGHPDRWPPAAVRGRRPVSTCRSRTTRSWSRVGSSNRPSTTTSRGSPCRPTSTPTARSPSPTPAGSGSPRSSACTHPER